MKIFAAVAAIIALAAVLSAFLVEWPRTAGELPSGGPIQTYPWQVELIDGGDNIRVFGLTPDRSTLADAAARFGEDAQIALFAAENGSHSAEAYFSRVDLGKLLGKVVVALDVEQATIAEWMERGREKTISDSGSLKVTPSPRDLAAINRSTLASLAFLPMVRLEPETIRLRFGEPTDRYRDGNGVEHWLWPAKGLDIALHQGRTKDVLQYQAPGRAKAAMGRARDLASKPAAPAAAPADAPDR